MVGIILWGLFIEEGCPIVGLIENFNSFYVYDANQYKVTRHSRGRSLVCTFCQNSLLEKVWSVSRVQTVQSSQLSGSLICCCHTLRHPSTLFLLSHFLVHLPMLLLIHHLVHLLVHFFFRTNAQICIRKGSSIFMASPFEESFNATPWWSNDWTHLLWGRRSWGRLRRHNSVDAECK